MTTLSSVLISIGIVIGFISYIAFVMWYTQRKDNL